MQNAGRVVKQIFLSGFAASSLALRLAALRPSSQRPRLANAECSLRHPSGRSSRLRVWLGRRCDIRRQQLGDGVDKAGRRGNGGGGFRGCNRRGGRANSVVGTRLELIGGAKKGNEIAPDPRLSPCQSGKFAP